LTLSVIAIVTSYAAIFIKVKKQSGEIQPGSHQLFSHHYYSRQIQEKKLAKTLFIGTVLSLATSWLPYLTYRILNVRLSILTFTPL
jgi:hypothetical protein